MVCGRMFSITNMRPQLFQEFIMNRVQFVQANRILLVPISQIVANPFQKRVEYGDIGELADRIAAAYASFEGTMGLMQVPRGRVVNGGSEPVPFQKVAPVSEDSADWVERGLRVQLMYGHRRYEAFKLLVERGDERYSQAVMPVQITDAGNRDMLLSVWEENERRQNLSAIEQAHLMAAAKEELGEKASQRDVAEFFGLARPTVANRLSLLDLPEEVQALNRTGQLSERQLLAMKPLYELEKKCRQAKTWAGIELRWNDQMSDYGWPMEPGAYARWLQSDKGQEQTSDDIRDYTRRIVERMGESLPETVAAFPAIVAGDIVQSECAGCDYRVNGSRCMVKKCLDAKMKAYGESLARQVAEEHMIEFSTHHSFFEGQDDHREAIVKAFRAGSCQHLVMGWQAEGYATRPFGKSSWPRDAFAKDSREGIILGHRGKLCEAIRVASGEDAIVARPNEDESLKWKKAAEKIVRVYGERVRAHLVRRMRLTVHGSDLAILVEMVKPKKYEEAGPDNYIELLVRHFYEKGELGYAFNSFEWYRRAEAFLDRVGLGKESLVSGVNPTERWRDRAIVTLAYYAERYRSLAESYYADTRQSLQSVLSELIYSFDDLGAAIDADIIELSAKVTDAAAYIQNIERKAEGKPESNGTLMQVLTDDAAACDECGDPFEEGDGVACSCGASRGVALCENCYVEHGHGEHDTNEDNRWLNEVGNED